MFVFGHEAQWSAYLEACLRVLSESDLMRHAEKALPFTVFALLRRYGTLDIGRIERIIEHLRRDVAPFMDISVAERFLKVGVAHFKEHDTKALMRLPLEERQVFARELGLPAG